jgi:hypothetical protein
MMMGGVVDIGICDSCIWWGSAVALAVIFAIWLLVK